MYESLKSVIKKLFPNLLYAHEDTLRKVLTWKYRGNLHKCNICETNLSSFINRENGDQLCPRCGSVGRTRRLFSLLSEVSEYKRVLHFSPPKALKKRLQSFDNFDYKTTDYENEFEADYRYDITNIMCPDNQFDLIICYHVLEHIIKDIQAMTELYRVLDDEGQVYIQTPFSNGELMEDYSISSREDRLLHYGQADHVRIYTAEVLINRLRQVGFEVEILEYVESTENNHGYKLQEQVLVARKKLS